MKKIISLFQRNYDGDRLVRNEIVPGAEWVAVGEGVATRKWDGTCCLVRDGRLYKRYEVKPGGKAPPNFEPANEVTGKQQGWVPVGNGPDDQWHREALDNYCRPAVAGGFGALPPDGTYELIGPKVQGNPEKSECHELVPHGNVPHGPQMLLAVWGEVPRDYCGLKAFLSTHDIEGIVWHHPDGRMVKIKTKDFGIKRPASA